MSEISRVRLAYAPLETRLGAVHLTSDALKSQPAATDESIDDGDIGGNDQIKTDTCGRIAYGSK